MSPDRGAQEERSDSSSDPESKESSKATPGRVAISVMLIVPDAEKAIDWYKKALGASELWNLGGVAGLTIEGAPIFLHQVNPDNPSEDCPAGVGGTSVRVEVFTDDPDGFVRRAEAAGATVTSSVASHQLAWGVHRQGGFTDPFGHKWSVGDRTPLREYGD